MFNIIPKVSPEGDPSKTDAVKIVNLLGQDTDCTALVAHFIFMESVIRMNIVIEWQSVSP